MVKDLLYPGNNYGDVKNVPVCQWLFSNADEILLSMLKEAIASLMMGLKGSIRLGRTEQQKSFLHFPTLNDIHFSVSHIEKQASSFGK